MVEASGRIAHKHDDRSGSQHRGNVVDDLIRSSGSDVFLDDHLDDIGHGLDQAKRTDPVRAKPVLETRHYFPLDPYQADIQGHGKDDQHGNTDHIDEVWSPSASRQVPAGQQAGQPGCNKD